MLLHHATAAGGSAAQAVFGCEYRTGRNGGYVAGKAGLDAHTGLAVSTIPAWVRSYPPGMSGIVIVKKGLAYIVCWHFT